MLSGTDIAKEKGAMQHAAYSGRTGESAMDREKYYVIRGPNYLTQLAILIFMHFYS